MNGPFAEPLEEAVDGKTVVLEIKVTKKTRTFPCECERCKRTDEEEEEEELRTSMEPFRFSCDLQDFRCRPKKRGSSEEFVYATEEWVPEFARELSEREVDECASWSFAPEILSFMDWHSGTLGKGYEALRVTAEVVMEMNEEMNEKYVDWKGHAMEPTKHDGKKAASFVCVTETLENMVFISNASNLITYFISYMHYPVAKSANMVTNFMGTSFILTLFGGFVSDSFITRFSTIILFGFIQFIGLVILAVQARSPNLRPLTGKTPSLSQEAMLNVGLYAVSMGVGGVKASLPAHGADQFDSSNKRLVSRYFNWHKVPTGSPFTRIFKVFVSTIQNRKNSVHPIVNPEQLDKKFDARFRQNPNDFKNVLS
ncbi:putative peptide/nitrate transporter [Acorus calamus]|uniref:Peptide/nitrate transporter n=1 Tax=Acorus calamus TaxID=4465 RepID=A0AAV9CZ77_ACOCL|nr:putative peptide/nitrate transporter [Acorus calamus]